MNKDELRSFCLSFPGATEQVQWEYDLLFKVGGKMFLVTNLEPAEITGQFLGQAIIVFDQCRRVGHALTPASLLRIR